MQKIPELDESLTKDEKIKAFANNAASLAWRMVTLQPPMVIDVQQKLDEEQHEREYHYWSDDMASDRLEFFRPTLFRSCMGELALKAWVGNHPKNLRRQKGHKKSKGRNDVSY